MTDHLKTIRHAINRALTSVEGAADDELKQALTALDELEQAMREPKLAGMLREVQLTEALELAMDNLRPHSDNCFLHDEGEYAQCFCGKDSLVDHLQSVIEGAAPPAQQAQPIDFADAYQGAMEEVAIWKRRALEAEELNRKFMAEINGATFMGEPAQQAQPTDNERAYLIGFADGKQAQAEAVPNRAFLERTLAAMEGVIDVADRKTDEFEAMRSCIVDLTLMLYANKATKKGSAT